MKRIRFLIVALAVFAAATIAGLVAGGESRPARAAFPGANGSIAFVRVDTVYVMNPDGSNQTSLGLVGFAPAWSADGSQIAVSIPDAGGGGDTDVIVASNNRINR